MKRNKVADIRLMFVEKLKKVNLFNDWEMLHLHNVSFIADENYIFSKPTIDYLKKEHFWYMSQSLNVKDMLNGTPKIWINTGDQSGICHSNYGWAVFSKENSQQFQHAVDELWKNKDSRWGTIIYPQPNVNETRDQNGRRDMFCTIFTQFFIIDSKLDMSVFMRSNDANFGYKNDVIWQKWVWKQAFEILKLKYPKLELGKLIWNATTLHIYRRDFESVLTYKKLIKK